MSDHSDAPDSKSHPQVDITDLFAFQKPGDPSRSILILNVNPQAPTQAGIFDPEASYEIKIDTNADALPEIAFHAIFNQGAQQDLFNRTPPERMRDTFLPGFVATLRGAGYSEDDATRTAEFLLPDILTYDYASYTGFPNGRNLTDDLLDYMLDLPTNGKVTSDLTGAHTDFLSSFPYLGPPHNV